MKKNNIKLVKKIFSILILVIIVVVGIGILNITLLTERKTKFIEIVFSSSGDLIAGRTFSSGRGKHLGYDVYIWDLARKTEPLRIKASPRAMAFSPDSRNFVYSSYESVVNVDCQTGIERFVAGEEDLGIDIIWLLKYLADGKTLVIGGSVKSGDSPSDKEIMYSIYFLDVEKMEIVGRLNLPPTVWMVRAQGEGWPDVTIKYLQESPKKEIQEAHIFSVKENKEVKRYEVSVDDPKLSYYAPPNVSFPEPLEPALSMQEYHYDFKEGEGEKGVSSVFNVRVIEKDKEGSYKLNSYSFDNLKISKILDTAYCRKAGLFAFGYFPFDSYYRWDGDGKVLVYDIKSGKLLHTLSLRNSKPKKVEWFKGKGVVVNGLKDKTEMNIVYKNRP